MYLDSELIRNRRSHAVSQQTESCKTYFTLLN